MRLFLILFTILFSLNSLKAQTATKNRKNKKDTQEIFIRLDKNAEFIGGTDSLYSYIRTHLKYPETALKDSIEGKVVITFIVDTNGIITNPIVIESVRPDLDQAAIEIIKNMPNWTPAMYGNRKVKVQNTLPIRYSYR